MRLRLCMVFAFLLVIVAGGREAPAQKNPRTSTGQVVRDSAIRFRDVAKEVGLTRPHYEAAHGAFRLVETMGSGVGLLDANGDDRLDIFVLDGSEIPADPNDRGHRARLYLNNGKNRYREASEAAGPDFRGYGQGVAVGDYDGDGDPDLYISALGSGALFRNEGGRFTDVTNAARIVDPGWGTSCAFADLDGDGDLDLYVVHYLADTVDAEGRPTVSCNAVGGRLGHCPPNAFRPEPDRLFRNNGDGTFTDVSKESGITESAGNGLGLAIADFDDDGKPDVFVANDQSPNLLFRNLGGMRFEEVGLAWGLAFNENGESRAGMGVACGDYDEDGRLDLIVTNFYEEGVTLYRNSAPGRFQVRTAAARLLAPTRSKLGFGAGFRDFDADGRLDLFLANGHINDVSPLGMPYRMACQVFRNDGGKFADVGASAGPYFRLDVLARGAAFGDLDGDGLEDAVVTHLGEPPAVLLNGSRTASKTVVLRITGPAALGATVRASVAGRMLTRCVVGGGSYLSASDGAIVLGVGDAEVVDSVQIRPLWGKPAIVRGPIRVGERVTIRVP